MIEARVQLHEDLSLDSDAQRLWHYADQNSWAKWHQSSKRSAQWKKKSNLSKFLQDCWLITISLLTIWEGDEDRIEMCQGGKRKIKKKQSLSGIDSFEHHIQLWFQPSFKSSKILSVKNGRLSGASLLHPNQWAQCVDPKPSSREAGMHPPRWGKDL